MGLDESTGTSRVALAGSDALSHPRDEAAYHWSIQLVLILARERGAEKMVVVVVVVVVVAMVVVVVVVGVSHN